jgi:hypothetical protein
VILLEVLVVVDLCNPRYPLQQLILDEQEIHGFLIHGIGLSLGLLGGQEVIGVQNIRKRGNVRNARKRGKIRKIGNKRSRLII